VRDSLVPDQTLGECQSLLSVQLKPWEGMMSIQKRGVTLVEVLIVLAILAIMFGLLLPAIQSVREAAARAKSMNNLRQIVLACHHHATDHGDRLPADITNPAGQQSFMMQLLPYCEQQPNPAYLSYMRLYISPADPTAVEPFVREGLCSYAGNGVVFDPSAPPRHLQRSFRDGVSNTMLFAEHYAQCNGYRFRWLEVGGSMTFTQLRPVFALAVRPETRGNPPVTLASGPDKTLTFQVRPCVVFRPDAGSSGSIDLTTPPGCGSRLGCDPDLAQTPHPGGMLAALADGSVRTLRPAIAPQVYWGSVTPSGGEVLDDW
jgi:prepilin-type N-terminal cleavage/methylation domain-containing protein